MIETTADKIWAAIQRVKPAISRDDILSILREGFDAPTADEVKGVHLHAPNCQCDACYDRSARAAARLGIKDLKADVAEAYRKAKADGLLSDPPMISTSIRSTDSPKEIAQAVLGIIKHGYD